MIALCAIMHSYDSQVVPRDRSLKKLHGYDPEAKDCFQAIVIYKKGKSREARI